MGKAQVDVYWEELKFSELNGKAPSRRRNGSKYIVICDKIHRVDATAQITQLFANTSDKIHRVDATAQSTL